MCHLQVILAVMLNFQLFEFRISLQHLAVEVVAIRYFFMESPSATLQEFNLIDQVVTESF